MTAKKGSQEYQCLRRKEAKFEPKNYGLFLRFLKESDLTLPQDGKNEHILICPRVEALLDWPSAHLPRGFSLVYWTVYKPVQKRSRESPAELSTGVCAGRVAKAGSQRHHGGIPSAPWLD